MAGAKGWSVWKAIAAESGKYLPLVRCTSGKIVDLPEKRFLFHAPTFASQAHAMTTTRMEWDLDADSRIWNAAC